MDNVIWKPQPRQISFMERPEEEALYGGAAGGGKSDALLMEALRQVHIPHYKGLLLRKTFPQLQELIDRSLSLYTRAFPRARYNASQHRWRFPSGASVAFGSMHHTADRVNYQGQQYDFIGFDELTHFTFDEYSYLFSRNRPSGPGTRVYMRATTNPGGVGHGWVKDRFISAAPPMTPITEEVRVPLPGGGTKVMTRRRIFVPATVFDNEKLLENDPGYLASLSMLPHAEKQALLFGSWDSFDGQVFREWKNDPEHYTDQRHTHVIAPFKVPEHWKIYRCFDFGYAKPHAIYWAAADTEGRLYLLHEHYGWGGSPNVGARMDPVAIAQEIKREEKEHPLLKGKRITGVADPSIFDESRGESIAQMMERAPNFVTWTPGDNTRLAGKMQLHYRLAFDKDGRPMLQVFNTCRHFIRTFPSLVYDASRVEDVDTRGEDHAYDAVRYLCMMRPISPRRNEAPQPPAEDPLDLWRDEQAQWQARFYRI